MPETGLGRPTWDTARGFTVRALARPAARTWDGVSRRGQDLGRSWLVPDPLQRLQQVGVSQNSVKSRQSVNPGET